MTWVVTDQGGNGNNTGTSLTMSPAFNIAGGSLLVVFVAANDFNAGTLSDSKGNTYSFYGSGTSGGLAGFLYFCLACTAMTTSDTVTYLKHTNNDSVGMSMSSATYSGVLSRDISQSAVVGNSAFPSITSGTPVASGELFIGCVAAKMGTGGSFTQASGWSNCLDFKPASASSVAASMGGYKINAGSGALTYNPTITSSIWVAFVVSFNAVASGTVMRTSLSQLGGRTGSRQLIGF